MRYLKMFFLIACVSVFAEAQDGYQRIGGGSGGGGTMNAQAINDSLNHLSQRTLTNDTVTFSNGILSLSWNKNASSPLAISMNGQDGIFNLITPTYIQMDVGDSLGALTGNSIDELDWTFNFGANGVFRYLDAGAPTDSTLDTEYVEHAFPSSGKNIIRRSYGFRQTIFDRGLTFVYPFNTDTNSFVFLHGGVHVYGDVTVDGSLNANLPFKTISSGYTDHATTTTGEDLLLTMGALDSTLATVVGERYVGEITGVFSNDVSTNRLRLYNVDDGTVGQQLVFDTGNLSNTATSTWVIRFTSITSHVSGGGYTVRVSASIQIDGLTVSSPVQYTEVTGGGAGDFSSFFQLTGQASGGAGKITETMYSFEYHK